MFSKTILMATVAVVALTASTQASATAYGVYGAATAQSASVITAQGDTAVVLNNLSAASLSGISVLWVLNSDYSQPLAALTTYAASVASFVSAGGVFALNDRAVDGAAPGLPGGGRISFTFSPASDVNVVTGGTKLTSGAGGTINNSTLDGGNSSDHGYAATATLPTGATTLLSTADSSQAVAFSYAYGAGHVYYSTIPLDFYLVNAGYGAPTAFSQIYAPNLVGYLDGISAGPKGSAVPEPASLTLLGVGLVAAGLIRRRA